MIKITRANKPSSLVKNEQKWLQKIKDELAKFKKAVSEKEKDDAKKDLDKAISKYAQTDIKETLKKMFHGKCAFCESKITHIDYGDIEHFKPKSEYPKLAIEWENLLLSCKVCNGASYKGSNFPLDTNGNPLLINPCDDDPNIHLEFLYDEQTRVSLVSFKDKKGEKSIEIYGLNRQRFTGDLFDVRNKKIRDLIFIAIHYHKDVVAKEIIDEACQEVSEYSAFAKMIKQKYT